MRSLRFLVVSLLTIFGLAVGGVVPAIAAQSGAKAKCKSVSALATGQGEVLPDGTIRTTATVTKDPLLKGTLEGQFVLTGDPSPNIPFAGQITFTTKKGTLTVQASGTLTDTGAFETSGPVITGTGDFAGASGDLAIEGNQDQTGAFTETIEGEICLSK
jgi:hypothetical protein